MNESYLLGFPRCIYSNISNVKWNTNLRLILILDVSCTNPLILYACNFTALHPILIHPPEWTPRPQKPARTPLPSTRIRVSPSPNKGSRSSPLITVSTTSTPIQPLQGNRQQYVIVQGNNRHLKGIARYKDSFRTPSEEENHQPIYLQGKARRLRLSVPYWDIE